MRIVAQLRPLVDALPSVRVLHLVRSPHSVVASRLRIKEFYAVGSEWNDDGTRLGVVNNVCDGMAAKLNASAELPALRAGGLLELTYESLLASPLQRIRSVYGWLGFTEEVPAVVRANLLRCAVGDARAHGAGERLRVDEPPRAASALRAHSVARARLGLEGRWQKRKVSFDGCAGSNKTLPLPQPVRDAIALRPSCVAVFLHYAFPPPDYEGAKRRALAFDVDVIKNTLGVSFGPLAPEPSAAYQP